METAGKDETFTMDKENSTMDKANSTVDKAKEQLNKTADTVKEKATEVTDKAKGMSNNLAKRITESDMFDKVKAKASVYAEHPEQINQDLTKAYNKVTEESGNQTIKSIWGKLESLFKMIRETVNGQYEHLSKPKLIVGIAVILYVIMPFDLLPDFLPVLGFADDAALLTWFVKKTTEEISHFESWEKSDEVGGDRPAGEPTSQGLTNNSGV